MGSATACDSRRFLADPSLDCRGGAPSAPAPGTLRDDHFLAITTSAVDSFPDSSLATIRIVFAPVASGTQAA